MTASLKNNGIRNIARIILIGSLGFSTSLPILSAQCPPGDVLLTSQTQVDSFLIDYPTCNMIAGSLVIGKQFLSDPNSDITDLSPLGNIEVVSTFLSIFGNDNLTSLNGLSNLNSITNSLIIWDNPGLTDISALGNINIPSTTINVTIIDNPVLPNLIGLQGITNISLINLNNNAQLSSLGLSITNVTTIFLQNLPSLTSLTGIGSFTEVNQLNIINCDALTNLAGPPALVGLDRMRISDNDNLTSIHGYNFRNLSTNSSLTITGNPLLSNLGDISTVGTTLGSGLVIENNASLSSISEVENTLGVGSFFSITNNPLITSINFPNIANIFGSIEIKIDNNAALTQITGMNLNTSAGCCLRVFNNPMLHTIDLFDMVNMIVRIRVLDNPNLQTLDLGAIQSATGDIDIRNNDAISNFAMPNLSTVGGSFSFTGSQLSNLTSLNNLTTVTSNFSLSGHPNLTDLTGLSSLTSTRNFGLSFLGITSFGGVNSLTTITGNLQITSNNSLQSLTGLPAITPSFDVFITNNTNLTSLEGLEHLTNIFRMTLIGNTSLQSLEGLENLVDISQSLRISGNTQLEDCTGICNLLQNGSIAGGLFLSGNLMGCNTESEILTSCSGPPTCEFETDTTFASITIPCNSKLQPPKVLDSCTDSLLCGVPLDSSFYFMQDTFMTQWAFTSSDGILDTVTQDIIVDGIVVCDSVSTGIGSLRNALACATQGDTINVFEGLMNDTLLLDTEGIMVDKDVIIEVDPNDNIALDASQVPSAFIINMGNSLTIDGLTIVSGNSPSAGTVLNDGILNLLNVIILPNPLSPGGDQFGGSGVINIDPLTTIFPE